MAWLALILFVGIFVSILSGYPVSFTLGGLSFVFALVASIFMPELMDFLDLLPLRIMGVMENVVFMAVPLFIFMGIMLEKSGLAESLLETMAMLFGTMRGGLAVSVVIVGALLAASTGIVGATVVTMGLISLPTMIKRGYSPSLASGTVAASGTLGQIIPPSVVLVLLGTQLNVPVGDLFRAALLPGLLLVLCYILYILATAYLKPESAPPIPKEEIAAFKKDNFIWKVLKAFFFPMLLIVAVLGSIFAGIASPTEAAAVGAIGAILLTALQGKLTLPTMKSVMRETTHLTCMVFLILLGATTFALVFRGLGGDDALVHAIQAAELSPMVFLVLAMAAIFVAGFFIDFIEIIFIFVPVLVPVFLAYEMNLVWIGILLALNLQTSFLTPPFGFSLFYLKGVAPPEVTTPKLYKGVVPFLIIQVVFLLLVLTFPSLVV